MIADKLQAVRAAQSAYAEGELRMALEHLAPHYRPMSEAQLMAAPCNNATAVRDWIALACDKLRAESGEDIIAICPVSTALATAAMLLSPE